MKAVNWNAVSGLASVATAAATVIALVFAGFQLQQFREEAKIQHLVERVNEFEGQRFTAIRRSLASKRIDLKSERLKALDPDDPPIEMLDELNFCDDIGLLTHRGAIGVHDVWSEFGYWLFPLYTDARPVIDSSRKESPASYVECSWLVEAIRPIETKEDQSSEDHPSEADIYGFYSGEVDTQPGQPMLKAKRVAKNAPKNTQ